MLSYEDARERILSGVTALAAETVPLAAAAGRVLAETVTASFDQPPFAASAMDGYAIRWADMPGPWRVVGESAAGKPFEGRAAAGEAIRIFTGAPLPKGADTILVQEDAHRDGETLTLAGDGPAAEAAHVRPRGNDFSAGAALAAAGKRLRPSMLGLAAAGGHGEVQVHRRPCIALIATGNELVPPGTAPGPAEIVASSSVMLGAQLARAGAQVDDFGIVADDLQALEDVLRRAADYDIVLTIGGASVGDHDLVRDALARAGASLDFWRIAIKPGKPLIFGRLGAARIVGLPGNPVSAFVCALLFVRPLALALQGAAPEDMEETARLAVPLPANGPRRDHLRAKLQPGGAAPLPTQDSAQLAVLAAADALIVRPPFAPAAEAGEEVPVIRLDSA